MTTETMDRRMKNPIRFNVEIANEASDEWGFNCGPGALCAVLDLAPSDIRSHLGNFESKRYTNPTLMQETLKRFGVPYQWNYHPPTNQNCWPHFGLARIQWGGPWCDEGRPFVARYRHTHWVATRPNPHSREGGLVQIFDLNATCVGGWLFVSQWRDKLVPWLLKEIEPKADGDWWITHTAELSIDHFE